MEQLLKYAEPAIIEAVDHLLDLVDGVTARVSQTTEPKFLPLAARTGITSTGQLLRAYDASYPHTSA
jgi:hypothetical protein